MSTSEWVHVSDGPWSRRRKHQAIVWNDKLLLLGGFDGDAAFDLNDVWSYDGNVWSLVTSNAGWSGRDGHCAVVFNGSIFILGGTDDPYNCKCDVWRSDDGGKNWRQLCAYAPWPERWQHAACVHNGKIYVMGGWGDRYLNDVWSSVDGIHWTQVCTNAPWKPRMFLSSISFNDAIYVIGGHDGRMQLRDVWASSDGGRSWTQVCQVAQWEGRQGHASVALNGHVYLMGGFGGAQRFNDLWKSSDCAHWSLVARHCTWSPRQGHACIGYRGRIYILGGFDESGYTNNVFCLPISSSVDCSADLSMPGAGSADSCDGYGDSSKRMRRPITVSMSTVIESIEELRQARASREKIIRNLVSVVGLVMKAATFSMDDVLEVNQQTIEEGADFNSHSADAGFDHTNVAIAAPEGASSATCDPLISENSFAEPPTAAAADPPINSISGAVAAGGGQDFEATMAHGGRVPIPVRRNNPGLLGADTSALGKRGSPWREMLLDMIDLKSLRSGASRSPRIISDEDLRMQIWRMLPNNISISRGGSFEDVAGSHQITQSKGNEITMDNSVNNCQPDFNKLATFSSAALRENMEHSRTKLNSLQRRIRELAERGDADEMEPLIAERTALADLSALQAAQLIDHVASVRLLQDARQKFLSAMLSKLENLVILTECGEEAAKGKSGARAVSPSSSSSSNNERSLRSQEDSGEERCSWTEWEAVVQKCSEAARAVDCASTELAIAKLRNELRAQAKVSNDICEWMTKSEIESPNFPASHGSFLSAKKSHLVEGFEEPPSPPHQHEQLSTEYQRVSEVMDKRRMAVKSAVDKEIAAIDAADPETRQLLCNTLKKGCGLVNSLISQNRLDIMEIASMETEVSDWMEIVECLKNRVELQAKCDNLVVENSAKEEQLLKLEDERIDTKSMLEKATLKGSRVRKTTVKSVSADESSSGLNDIEEIRAKHAIAEKAVREARRSMRAWYREVKEFAIRIAPELFQMLPDLRVAGSLLGDGGFAENARLPQRKLDEYENITPLMQGMTDLKNLPSSALSARHVLLKATYDGEEVVLKGFIMHEGDQRKGLERELSILSRLRNDCVISPAAIVEDNGSCESPYIQVAVFIEYPYYRGGNLSAWLKTARKPWELQGVARQLLYGILYLHDHSVIHRDIKPSNVLMHEDGRVVLADFELSREIRTCSVDGEEASTTTRSGTRGFMAPEIESGGSAVFASDMYSFGVVLLYMHLPGSISTLVPGNPQLPPTMDAELADLIQRLLVLVPAVRPTAATALMHPYFRTTFVDRLLQEGEVVEQDRKLEAVRNLFHNVRTENRTNLDRLSLRREEVVETVLNYFQELPLEKMRFSLKLIFLGEPGIDEGGLLTEMFTIFFEAVLSGDGGLFEGPTSDSADEGEGAMKTAFNVVLPSAADETPERLKKLRAFGRAMVKTLYEGRRMGNRLCPSVFKFLTNTAPSMRDLQMFDPQSFRSLQWMLATVGVEQFGLHFESVGAPELGAVNDTNKANFVRMKIDRILVKSRLPHLVAIKTGFTEAVRALSEEAAPFLQLLSHTDWRVMLCGDTAISGPQINSTFRFSGFPKKSQIPQWLKEIINSSSEDHLRKFLVFVTGSPSLSGTSRGRTEINVRFQARSSALPVAHTCFFHLDIPDYRDKETLQTKLIYAIQHATSFEIV